ncbi:hypothetical protein ACLK19_00250 [Escherichia coli]
MLTSYGMTETIVGVSAIALAINDAGRRLVGHCYEAEIHDNTRSPLRQVNQ